MTRPLLIRSLLLLLLTAGFTGWVWQLMATAPESGRERPPAPVPLVDVIASSAGDHAVSIEAAGTVSSAYELAIRTQVGGRIIALHADFEPGGLIPADQALVRIDPTDYQLEIAAAEADVAKARATIALEQGRRVVAREELASLGGSLELDRSSQGLALREPQLRQVQAELAAAENRLDRAHINLERTELSLPFDVIVLERERVTGEIVAARERIGRVTRADTYWLELRISPSALPRLRARIDDTPGSAVTLQHAGQTLTGEIVRMRADVAEGSRLAGVIAALPVDEATSKRLLLGSYVEARIDAGIVGDSIPAPRRAVRDNGRVWVVDSNDQLQVRDAEVTWRNAQSLLLAKATLQAGDRVVVSRISGLVAGTPVRVRKIDTTGMPND